MNLAQLMAIQVIMWSTMVQGFAFNVNSLFEAVREHPKVAVLATSLGWLASIGCTFKYWQAKKTSKYWEEKYSKEKRNAKERLNKNNDLERELESSKKWLEDSWEWKHYESLDEKYQALEQKHQVESLKLKKAIAHNKDLIARNKTFFEHNNDLIERNKTLKKSNALFQGFFALCNHALSTGTWTIFCEDGGQLLDEPLSSEITMRDMCWPVPVRNDYYCIQALSYQRHSP